MGKKRKRKSAAQKLTIEKWKNLGLLDNIDGCVVQGKETAPALMDTLIFPMAKRVFAQTIAQDLVSVQPMDPPGWWSRTPLEKLKGRYEDLKGELAKKERNLPRIGSLETEIKDLLPQAIPGLSPETIEKAMNDHRVLDKLINVESLGSKFGI